MTKICRTYKSIKQQKWVMINQIIFVYYLNNSI